MFLILCREFVCDQRCLSRSVRMRLREKYSESKHAKVPAICSLGCLNYFYFRIFSYLEVDS